jgi:hypothetical protein
MRPVKYQGLRLTRATGVQIALIHTKFELKLSGKGVSADTQMIRPEYWHFMGAKQ